MTTEERIREVLKKERYTQSGNFRPVYIGAAALSGFLMKEELGFGYTQLMFRYYKDYGDMNYLWDDLNRLWDIIWKKLRKEGSYLDRVRERYEEIFIKHDKFIDRIRDVNLNDISDDELLQLLKDSVATTAAAVGIAHVLEPIGLGLEKTFEKQLRDEIGEEKSRRYYSRLTVPSQPSFVAKEEEELRTIGGLSAGERDEALEKHRNKHYWLKNSYLGAEEVTVSEFEGRMSQLLEEKRNKAEIKSPDKLMDELKVSDEARRLVRLVDMTTMWQDERKVNIMRAVGAMGKIIDEVGRRLNMEHEAVRQLVPFDIAGLNNINDIEKLKDELTSRIDGAYVLMEGSVEYVASGGEFIRLQSEQKEIEGGQFYDTQEIRGSTAHGGTVIGEVAVCESLNNLEKVKEGDVLVTSMTRPEYMPALKKAAAIVTDEGGITSHAAIVSRELNIPAIIGTKVATKVLKDGMRVEVKANHGVVRILSGDDE